MTPSLHRLNRTEYANAIRDLLDLEVDVSTLLPGDGSSEGFDNLADGLSISPTLIQGYVAAAMKISRLAVGDRTLPPSQAIYPAPPALAQDRHIDGLPLGTRGGMLVRHTFPLDAEYQFGSGAGGRGGGAGRRRHHDRRRNGHGATGRGALRVKVAAGPRMVGIAVVDRQRGGGRGRDLFGLPNGRIIHADRRRAENRHHGPVQSNRPRRHTEPPPDSRLPSGAGSNRARRRRDRVRAQDPRRTRPARVSRAGDGARSSTR